MEVVTNTNLDFIISEHSLHQESSKVYLPLLYGNSEELTCLDLENCHMTDVAVGSLCDALRTNTKVHTINASGNLIGTEGCHALASLLENNNTIRSLLLSNNPLTDVGCKSLLEALVVNTSLIRIDIDYSNKLTSSLVDAIRIMVRLNTVPGFLKENILSIQNNTIRLIDLSFDSEEFRVTEKKSEKLDCWAAERISDALINNRTVEVLRLCNQQVGDNGARALSKMLHQNERLDKIDLFGNVVTATGAEAFIKSIDTNNTIQFINLKSNCVSDEILFEVEKKLSLNSQPLYLKKYLPLIADNDPTVCDLVLDEHESFRYYNDVSVRLLSEAIVGNDNLTSLNLSNNQITDVGVSFLSEALKTNNSIKSLNLNNNKLGSNGAKHLAEALKLNKSLLILRLMNTQLDDVGGEALASAAMTNSTLTQLDLSFNPNIRESGSHFVKAVQHTNQLKDLVLRGTAVSGVTLKALRDCKAVASEPPILRITASRLHRGDETLTKVDLSGKAGEFVLTDSSAFVLGPILKENYILTDINLSNNEITNNGVAELCEGLLHNKYTLKRLDLSSNRELDYETSKLLCGVLRQHRALKCVNLANNTLLDGGGKVFFDFIVSHSCNNVLVELNVSHNRMEQELETSLAALVESHRCLPGLKPKIIKILEKKIPKGILYLDNIESITDPDTPDSTHNHAAFVVSLAIEKSEIFTGLSFKGNRIGDSGVAHLCSLFRSNVKLVTLDLSNNKVSNAGVQLLVDMIGDKSAVKSIELSGNKNISEEYVSKVHYTLQFNSQPDELKILMHQILKNEPDYTVVDCTDIQGRFHISDLQLIFICQSLVANSFITTVKLGHNYISLSGGIHLIDTLKKCPNITSVSLRNNVFDGYEIVEEFSKFLTSPEGSSLTHIDLAHNALNESCAPFIIETLRQNDTLLELNLKGTNIPDDLLEEMERTVQLNRELEVKRLIPRLIASDLTVTLIDLSSKNIDNIAIYSTCAALQGNVSVTSLDFSFNKLVSDVSAISYLAPLLKSNTTPIKILSLSNTGVTSRGVITLLKTLQVNTTLEKFDVSSCDLSPGRQVVAAAEECFSLNSTLLEICLDQTGLSPHELNRIVAVNLNGQPLLRWALPRLVSNDKTVTDLNFTEGGKKTHDDSTCVLLSESLLHNSHLRSLNLSGGNISDEGMSALSNALNQNNTLTELSLKSCRITDVGANSLAQALCVNNSLVRIDVSNNLITSLGCKSLTRSLSLDGFSNSKVKYIHIDHNTGIKENRLVELGLELSLNRGPLALKYDLPKIRENEVSILNYCDTSFDEYVSVLVSALKNNKSVKTLELSNCDIKLKSIEQLSQYLRETSSLTKLNISKNDIGNEISVLIRAMTRNQSIISLNIDDTNTDEYHTGRLREMVKLNWYTPNFKKTILRSMERDPTLIAITISGDLSNTETVQPIDDDGVEVLCEHLRIDSSVKEINLPHNAITCKGTQFISTMLRINDSITVINLSRNKISDDGIQYLSDTCCNHKSLTHIDVSYNNITDEGARTIMKLLHANWGIKKLLVEGNELISTDLRKKIKLLGLLNGKSKQLSKLFGKVTSGNPVESIKMEGWLGQGFYDGNSMHLISEAISQNQSVKSLNISFCDVTDSQVVTLAQLVSSSSLTSLTLSNNLLCSNLSPLLNALIDTQRIRTLDLRDNKIGLQGAKQLADFIRRDDYLTEIDISGNKLGEIGIKIITEAIKMNDSLQEVWAEATDVSKEALLALTLSVDVSYRSQQTPQET